MPEIVKVFDLRVVWASLGCLGVGTTLTSSLFTVFCRHGVVIRVLEPYSAFLGGPYLPRSAHLGTRRGSHDVIFLGTNPDTSTRTDLAQPTGFKMRCRSTPAADAF